jgi:glutamate/tyrosine decarboxylase-like PLP-dependent enzyme
VAGAASTDPRLDLDFVAPWFFGPAAENAAFVEELLVEFLRDHAAWRRAFHPEDRLASREELFADPAFLAARTKMRRELLRLSSALQQAVPFFHPRYVGHMTGDLLLPGIVAKLLTTLYNPNNVSEEGAPVTTELELEVGDDLARMLGFSVVDGQEPCGWGHLTSGGTVANYEALWNLRSAKFFGVALQSAAALTQLDPLIGGESRPLSNYSVWELVNLPVDDMISLRRDVLAWVTTRADPLLGHAFAEAVRRERIESLGTAAFFSQHRPLQPPQVVVPASAHYSWAKGMKVLGLGTANLLRIPVDHRMRMVVSALEEQLARLSEQQVPVLCVVGMLGTTEFGAIDPIHEIVALRGRFREQGLDFGIHVDGAWGGYLASIFRRPDGSRHSREEVRDGLAYFPSQSVYEAFAAVPAADSVTIDPHKLGYVPYAAGAIVVRNREVVDFLTQDAAYVFDRDDAIGQPPRRRQLANLGQYILEGSKPGAAAAAVHVTHRSLPLDSGGLGRILKLTIRISEMFLDSVAAARERLADRVRLCVPFEPDTNLICLAVNPVGNTSVAAANDFGRAVFARLKADGAAALAGREFIGSYTSLTHESMPAAEAARILAALNLDPATFVPVATDRRVLADHLFILRHTLMNPWFLAGNEGDFYLDKYWRHLEEVIDAVLLGRNQADRRTQM